MTILLTLAVIFFLIIRSKSILIVGVSNNLLFDSYQLFFENVTTDPEKLSDYTLKIDSDKNLPNPFLLRLWLFFSDVDKTETEHWSITSRYFDTNLK